MMIPDSSCMSYLLFLSDEGDRRYQPLRGWHSTLWIRDWCLYSRQDDYYGSLTEMRRLLAETMRE